jgi:hypothetical protein
MAEPSGLLLTCCPDTHTQLTSYLRQPQQVLGRRARFRELGVVHTRTWLLGRKVHTTTAYT